MVNKGDKPTETTLARGRILPSELLHVLEEAAKGATWVFVHVYWRDGHDASVTSIEDLHPIEDANNVFSVHGRFDYEDDSRLTMDLRESRQSTLSAKGHTARARQAAVGQIWASIPGRAQISSTRWGLWLWAGAFGLICGAASSLVVAAINAAAFHQETSVLGWAVRTACALFAIALFLLVRKLTHQRLITRLIVLHRPESRVMEFWTVVAGVGTVAAVIWGVFVYLFPPSS